MEAPKTIGNFRNNKIIVPSIKYKQWLPPTMVFIFFMLFWQFGIQLLQIPAYLIPKPTDIYQSVLENQEQFFTAVQRTVAESVIGFILSVIGGVLGAIIMANSKWLERSLYPYAIILQTIPVVAIAPIIVIWFGSGMNAIVIIAFIIGFFPMLSNTLIGLRSVDRNMENLFVLYNAMKWQTMWKLRLPAALPYMMAGLKISCTLAVIGAIVGEYIAGIGGGDGGLGYSITVASSRLQTSYLFACGLAASLLGIFFYLLISLISKAVLGSWHESEMKMEK
ncbi:binding-protein-dependent transport systems inner membrane component [Bacillus methanolicus PB1]|uniref:Binding-protein-dependent transport systems inner membrane component n=1 Tax=Bacillus methanolicus PB1 TaxID=997296 RepID=I3E1Q2_BACMT|nr:ABC transporter permease [Bacillus methanolicus]EIJ80423.1 binding-protein-dependent transport systems inner membrane component [Bacillus methanolicus PB1]